MSPHSRETRAPRRLATRRSLVPAFVLALTLVALIFIAYEYVERTRLADTDMHGLHRLRLYEAYGQARHRWRFDVNSDAREDILDVLAVQNAIAGASPDAAAVLGIHASYDPDADFDHDGNVDYDDYILISGQTLRAALPSGEISDPAGPENPFGFTGFVYNVETNHSLARNRYYDPYAGRWLEHDPAGYADGMSLYQFFGSSPAVGSDPYGLGPWDWIPSLSDVARGRTVLYQMTPTWNEFASGRTIVNRTAQHVASQGEGKVGRKGVRNLS